MDGETNLPLRPPPSGSQQARSGNARGRGNPRHRGRRGQNPSSRPDSDRPPQNTKANTKPGANLSTEDPLDASTLIDSTRKTRAPSVASSEAEVCFICASPVVYHAVSPCNHRTCHICALRLRALYKTNACAHCRAESQYVIFTNDAIKRYEDFKDSDIAQIDNLGVKYENSNIYEDTVLLLRFNCPDPTCDEACTGWNDLQRHVRSVHHKNMCDLCIRNKKVFTHEHELFTREGLRKHEKFGDDNPGAIDQSGFKGHPECGFCRQRFYGDDELYAHCRDKHERCHICDRRTASRQPTYYENYNALQTHFGKEHHLCFDQECLEKKFVVFESEMDLKAHQLEVHPGNLSKDARRDARRVDLSNFDFRSPEQSARGGRQGGRARGRGRDPNTDPIPHSSAQPLRRDELAYQRQMAIQSAQSVTSRTFGGQLTGSDSQSIAREPVRQPQSSTQQHNPAQSSPPHGIDTSSLTAAEPRTPEERIRHERHQALIRRATVLLNDSSEKLTYFRNSISAFRSSKTSAADLISLFSNLFPISTTELGTLLRDLAELFEDPQKQEELRRGWNDYKASKQAESDGADYPVLSTPGSSGSSSRGMRVLRLKSSTAQSSRSPVNRESSWGQSSNPFPPMPKTANGEGSSTGASTAWKTVASTRKTPAATTPVAPAPGPKPKPQAAPNTDAFPALPVAAVNRNAFGYGIGNSRIQSPANPWGGLNSLNPTPSQAASIEAAAAGNLAEGSGEAKKKGGRKKQVLFHYG